MIFGIITLGVVTTMIRNRLAELLSERGLKITKVAKDTGISRNTITSTSQNDSKMIQYETIDVLCQYLGVTPKEFFQYNPMRVVSTIESGTLTLDVKVIDFLNSPVLTDLKYRFDFFIDISERGKEFDYSLSGEVSFLSDSRTLKTFLTFDDKEEISSFNQNIDKLEIGFIVEIEKEIETKIKESFRTELKRYIETEIREVYRKDLTDSINSLKWTFDTDYDVQNIWMIRPV